MDEEVQIYLDEATESMDKAIEHYEQELSKIRAGKANPSMLNGVTVDYYGIPTPLNQVANVSTPDARSLVIKPWEKAMLEPIEKGILQANIGLTPQSDGEVIRLNLPILTEDRRKELVKQVRAVAENGRIKIRNIRRDANDGIKDLGKDGLSEDNVKDAEAEVQNLTNKYISKIDGHLEAKEAEIMTV